MSEAVKLVEAGQAPRHVQNEEDMTYEGPWEGDIAQIDWSQDAQTVHNFIRGSDRAPGAWGVVGGERVTLLGSTRVPITAAAQLAKSPRSTPAV